jgi:hypothetical protein
VVVDHSSARDGSSRDKALHSSWLADSYIDAGKIEQATAVVQSSLIVMGNVSSVRPRERLGPYACRPGADTSVPSLRTGRDHLDQVVVTALL